MIILLSASVILAWGLWLVPSQNTRFPSTHSRTFYISISHLILAIVPLFSGRGLSLLPNQFLLIFAGGFIWSVSGWFAFIGTERIGMSRAAGIWAPLNILSGLIWGIFLFNEFPNPSVKTILMLTGSLILIFSGIFLILRSKKRTTQKSNHITKGIFGAVMAGILWGSYFIPVKFSGVHPWDAVFPQAVGMVAGAVFLLIAGKGSLKLNTGRDYVGVAASGIIWTIGNFAMLLLVEKIGAGKGFMTAQLSLLVNAAAGILILKDPPLKSKGAVLISIGIIMAALGGTILGSI